MKIAIVMPLGSQQGGAELMFRQFVCAELGRRMCALVIFLEDGPLVEEIRRLGVAVEVIVTRRLRHVWQLVEASRRIALLLRQTRVDGVLSWMLKGHFYAGLAAILAGVPALWFQHGLADGLLDRLGNLWPARGVLGSSKAICASQARLWPRRPVRVVYPGIDLVRFQAAAREVPAEVRRRLGLVGEGPWIGIVGRLQRGKGMHVLVQAFAEVLRFSPAAQCLIVGGPYAGDPDYPNSLRSLIREQNLGAKVHLTGAQENIPEWMQAMDVVVHASDREGFGIVVMEAMALGKPVIATPSGGPQEFVRDGRNGLLVPHGDITGLAAAILRYLSDPDFAAAMGRAARTVADRFSLQSFASSLESAISELLATARPVLQVWEEGDART